VNCIRELVLDGNAVKIPNLAIFSAGLKTKGADNLNDFNVATNVLSAHLRARPCGDFTRAELTAAARVQEAGQYNRGEKAEEGDNKSSGTSENVPSTGGEGGADA